ncbi:hypothetical protein MRO13_05185 [Vibrio metschnikovii]
MKIIRGFLSDIDVSKETLLMLLDNVDKLVESPVEKSVNQLEEPDDLPF